MVERRKYKRLDISIPVNIKMRGTIGSLSPINLETDNISRDGLSVEIKIRVREENGRLSLHEGDNFVRMVPYLLLNYRALELGFKILPGGGMIKGIGKVMWYDRGLRGEFCSLRAGIFIEEMESKHRENWLELLRTIARI